MRTKYKVGDTIFFTITTTDEAGERIKRQSFGCIKKITIQIDDVVTAIHYETNEELIDEGDILGRAVIQKARVRASRSKKVVEAMKAMNGQHAQTA